MNIEYTYIDGKAIISDENGKKTQSEYYDNLDKVLAQENLIEAMENIRQELEKESASYGKYNRKRYIPFIFPMSALMTTVGTPLITSWLAGYNTFTQSIDTVFGPMSQAMAVTASMSICILPLCAGMELVEYHNHKSAIKKEQGINSELDFLNGQIEIERAILESLKQDKSRDNESTEFRTVKIDDLEQLQMLKSYLSLYFDLGYNGKKYYRYYQQGQLDRKLQKYYDEAERQIAKEYIEEKGPSLVLRKKKNDTNNSQK